VARMFGQYGRLSALHDPVAWVERVAR
jgi:hypothetical protein